MNKYEFENALQRSLTGKVSSTKLKEIVTYYNDYIDTEIRKGKPESEVVASLGNPKLLAKSIIQTEGTGDERFDDYDESDDDNEYRQYDENEAGKTYRKKNKKSLKDTIFYYNGKPVERWKMYLLATAALAVLAVLLILIFAVVGVIVAYLFPVLVVVGVVYLVISVLSTR